MPHQDSLSGVLLFQICFFNKVLYFMGYVRFTPGGGRLRPATYTSCVHTVRRRGHVNPPSEFHVIIM